MHVPQSSKTEAEVRYITNVPRQMIALKNNSPVMGLVQDALLGMFLFTGRDTFLSLGDAMNLLMWMDENDFQEGTGLKHYELPLPAVFRPEMLWTGKQIISLMIPRCVSLQYWKGKD